MKSVVSTLVSQNQAHHSFRTTLSFTQEGLGIHLPMNQAGQMLITPARFFWEIHIALLVCSEFDLLTLDSSNAGRFLTPNGFTSSAMEPGLWVTARGSASPLLSGDSGLLHGKPVKDQISKFVLVFDEKSCFLLEIFFSIVGMKISKPSAWATVFSVFSTIQGKTMAKPVLSLCSEAMQITQG